MTTVATHQLDHVPAGLRLKRYLIPPIVGLSVTLMVLGGLNIELLAARYHYWRFRSTHKPTTSQTVTPPPASTNVSTPLQHKPAQSVTPRIYIPSIDVNAPIVFDEPSIVEWKVQVALRRGVVHYGTTAEPGKAGNAVLFGHSSGMPFAPGDYKFVFTLLEKVAVGDEIGLDYNGIHYTYHITSKQVVSPNDGSILSQNVEGQQLSVVTCTPVGTSKNRLVVHAVRVD